MDRFVTVAQYQIDVTRLMHRLRPGYPGHVRAYDFVDERTHDGRKFRILTIIDQASRECLTLVVARPLRHEDVLAALAELFIERGPPAHVRSDNGSEFIATAVQTWLGQIGVKTLCIAPGSPGENGYNELQRLSVRRTSQRWDLLQSRLPTTGTGTGISGTTMHQPTTRTTQWGLLNGGRACPASNAAWRALLCRPLGKLSEFIDQRLSDFMPKSSIGLRPSSHEDRPPS